jgi:SAM-dependent methyltransferase
VSYAARTKYDEPGRARRYRGRSPRRDTEEWRLLERMIRRLPEAPARALDAPCGTGRIAERLLDLGVPTIGADLSPAMRAEAEARLAGREGWLGTTALDLEAHLPDHDLASDLVVCFRFLPHLPDAASRARVLESLRRLTKRDLLLSFHHPVSAHNLMRALRRLFGRRHGDRRTITVGRLRREAAQHGLELVATRALGRWRRELWVAWLRCGTAP